MLILTVFTHALHSVAGPGEMVAAIRDALSTGPASPGAVLKGSPSVTLHVETFGMTRK